MNIKTKQIFIEISVRFEEPLQEVELVKEKSIEIPSCSAHYLDDEIGSDGYDFDDMIYDISQKQISGSESDSELQRNLPTWAKKRLLPLGKTLEILLIQEEHGLIFKEQVLHSLVMII